MNAKQLYWKRHHPAGVWVCETCKLVSRSQDVAESCCRCRKCFKPCPRDCGNVHPECWRRHQKERMAERLESAEEVTAYDGFVFVDGWGPQDGYFPTAEDAADYIQDTAEGELPQWAFCCTSQPTRQIDAGNVLEWMADDMYDDAYDDFTGVDELQAALGKFNEANKGLLSWNVDYTRKVRLFSDTKG